MASIDFGVGFEKKPTKKQRTEVVEAFRKNGYVVTSIRFPFEENDMWVSCRVESYQLLSDVLEVSGTTSHRGF